MFNYERFDELRRSKGITQKFIAASLGRSSTLCQDWKHKKSQPSLEQLNKLASILGTTVEYLIDESDEVCLETDEMTELLTSLRERSDMRMLFQIARNATPDDVRQAVKIIEALRRDD